MAKHWIGALMIALVAETSAHAFCGFYVAGARSELFNNATQVVMMREGTTTVLSMQNDYQGPPEDFAMVVPVPEVLQEANVKTLPHDVFVRVDQLAAPRLVEYWEQDPCPEPPSEGTIGLGNLGTIGHGAGGGTGSGYGRGAGGRVLQVQVEAEFAVGEYEIVILSSQDSSDLETWLTQNGYHIPAGAAEALRPYVEADMKFFVAKVNVEEVEFSDGRAKLSPLRVHYDSESFALPVRLGMLNSNGKQDLVVHVLARNQRYQLANYEHVTIPTNLDVQDPVRERFGEFYAALFDRVLEQHPRAVVTEYAWQAQGCDPCPGPVLSPQDLITLGDDVALGVESANVSRGGGFRRSVSRIRPGRPTVDGPLASEIIRRVVRRHINELRFCYDQELVRNPTLAGRVELSFTIARNGSVASSSVSSSTLSNASAETCMWRAVRRWRFPSSEGVVRVTYPVILASGGGSTSGGAGRGFGRGGGTGISSIGLGSLGTIGGSRGPSSLQDIVLTRLHYRYGRGELGEDLVFEAADPIVGGREIWSDGEISNEASESSTNNFQGRYVIRHEWEGEIECENPRRGVWGGPPPSVERRSETLAATDTASAPRGGLQLGQMLTSAVPSLGVSLLAQPQANPVDVPAPADEDEAPSESRGGSGGCGGCSASGGDGAWLLVLLGLLAIRRFDAAP